MFKITGLYDLNRTAKTKREGGEPKLRVGTEDTENGGYSNDATVMPSSDSLCQVSSLRILYIRTVVT